MMACCRRGGGEGCESRDTPSSPFNIQLAPINISNATTQARSLELNRNAITKGKSAQLLVS